MALVSAATRADDLRADHAVTRISDVAQMLFSERRSEARPARAALKFGSGFEQGQAAQPAGKNALAFFGEKHAAKRRFRAVLEQHVPLFIAEIGDQIPPLLLAGRREVELHSRG